MLGISTFRSPFGTNLRHKKLRSSKPCPCDFVFRRIFSAKMRRVICGRIDFQICRIKNGLSYPLRLAPLDTSPYISVSYHFFCEKMVRVTCGILTERQPRARGALLRYIAPPSLPRWGKVPFLSCSCSAFRKGKKCITSDALFADSCQRFYLFYRNPAFLSPPVLRTTSPFQKGRQGERAKRKGDKVAKYICVSPVPSEPVNR